MRKIFTQIEEFRTEPTIPLHDKIEEEFPKDFRQSTLVCPVPLQEQPPDYSHPQGYTEDDWNTAKVLNLKRFKEAVFSYAMN